MATISLLASASSGPVGSGAPALDPEQVGVRRMDEQGNAVTDHTSKNWSGYATTVPGGGADFKSVHARWVHPTVQCPAFEDAWVVFWVGMDGWGNNVVEQGGSSAHCEYGIVTLNNLWWEMYPYNQIQSGAAINPGDTIDATVTYNESDKTFDIVVKDLTNGATLTQNQPCHSDMQGCPRVSAEVVSETPLGGSASDGVFYLPNYGSETYVQAEVTDMNGHTGPLSDPTWNLAHIDQVSKSGGVTKQTTSSLDATGSSFSTTWVHN